jgi:hypothetical protein
VESIQTPPALSTHVMVRLVVSATSPLDVVVVAVVVDVVVATGVVLGIDDEPVCPLVHATSAAASPPASHWLRALRNMCISSVEFVLTLRALRDIRRDRASCRGRPRG